MSTTYVAVILLASLSCLTTCIGVALAVRFQNSIKGIAVGIGFSAGIMLLISCFELVPESLAQAGVFPTFTATAGGIAFIWVLHFIIPHTHLVEEKGMTNIPALRAAYLVVFGLILHDVPEGFAMANSYIASPSLGFLVALAIALHNIPEEFAMAVPVVPLKKPFFLYGAAVLSGLAEPVGAVIGLVTVGIFPLLNPLLMSFAAGAMIFVSIHEFLPMARRYGHPWLFTMGMTISLPVYLALAILIPE